VTVTESASSIREELAGGPHEIAYSYRVLHKAGSWLGGRMIILLGRMIRALFAFEELLKVLIILSDGLKSSCRE